MSSSVEPGFLVLAAGQSLRFGSSCKLMAELPTGRLLLEQTLETILTVSPKICLVSSENTRSVIDLARSMAIDCCTYPGISPGIGSSIARGVSYAADWPGWVICLGDMPYIDADVYQGVRALAKDYSLVAPVFTAKNGARRRGHPVYFADEYRQSLKDLSGDRGAQKLLESHCDGLKTFDTPCEGILKDVDVFSDILIS